MTSRLRCVIRARGSWAALTALALTHAPAPPLAYAQAASPSAPTSPVPPPAPGSSAAGAVDASLAGGGAAPPPGETAPAASESAPAASDACIAERFIVLESRGFAPDLFAEVRTDFATELRHRGLDVCDAASTERAPAALVELEARDDMVVIELDDRVTHKRVARDLPLRNIPANGRALAIAIASDELLRASWAELTLTRERSGGETDDASEDETYDAQTYHHTVNARGRARRRPPRYQLGVDLGYLHTADSFDAFSLNARAAVRPWQWGWFELSVGGLGALPASSPSGDVIASGFRSTFVAGACTRQDKPAHSCAGARAGLSVLSFRGLHPELASAHSKLGVVVDGTLVAQLGARLSSTLTLLGELGVGAVLHGTNATDGTSTVMGVTGLLLSANLGLGFDL